jgi:hypothetical protein
MQRDGLALHLDVIVNGNNSPVFVECKLVALDGEFDGVLGLEDLIEFLELCDMLAPKPCRGVGVCLPCAFGFLGRRRKQ